MLNVEVQEVDEDAEEVDVELREVLVDVGAREDLYFHGLDYYLLLGVGSDRWSDACSSNHRRAAVLSVDVTLTVPLRFARPRLCRESCCSISESYPSDGFRSDGKDRVVDC